jgi:hypothetical protein
MAWSFWRRLMNSSTVHWSIWIPFKKHVPPLSVYYTHIYIYIYIHIFVLIYGTPCAFDCTHNQELQRQQDALH